jgi:hypothetical protein
MPSESELFYETDRAYNWAGTVLNEQWSALQVLKSDEIKLIFPSAEIRGDFLQNKTAVRNYFATMVSILESVLGLVCRSPFTGVYKASTLPDGRTHFWLREHPAFNKDDPATLSRDLEFLLQIIESLTLLDFAVHPVGLINFLIKLHRTGQFSGNFLTHFHSMITPRVRLVLSRVYTPEFQLCSTNPHIDLKTYPAMPAEILEIVPEVSISATLAPARSITLFQCKHGLLMQCKLLQSDNRTVQVCFFSGIEGVDCFTKRDL